MACLRKILEKCIQEFGWKNFKIGDHLNKGNNNIKIDLKEKSVGFSGLDSHGSG
jgi:hypothetical protein